MPRNPHIEAVLRDRFSGRRKVPKPIRQQPARGLERTYLRDILQLLKPAQELVEQLFLSRMPELDAEISVTDSVRTDAYPEIIERVFGDIRLRYEQIVGKGAIRGAATDQAVQLDMFNRQQVTRQLKRPLGIDVFGALPQLSTEISAFTTSNVKLITSIPEKYFRSIEDTALRNLRAGNRFESWKGQLPKLRNNARSSAALIARDQTNKFNGELNKARHQSLGMDDYTWRTSQDERVRESHQALDGRKFSYTDSKRQPPEGHPGEPVQCRCQAEPDVEGALEQAGV